MNDTPSNGTKEALSQRRHQRAVLLAVAVAILCFNLYLSPNARTQSRGPQWLVTLGMGVVFAEPVLCALWAVIGPGSLIHRVPLTSAALILLLLADAYKGVNLHAGPNEELNTLHVPIVASFAGIYVVLVPILLLIRRWAKFRIDCNEVPHSKPGRSEGQFGLKYLLALTTICALPLAIGRAYRFEPMDGTIGTPSPAAFITVLILVFVLILLPPAFLTFLALSRSWRWVPFVITIVTWLPGLWCAAAVVNQFSPTGQGRWQVLWPFLLTQLGALVAGLLAAIPLRLAGYRLGRVADAPTTSV